MTNCCQMWPSVMNTVETRTLSVMVVLPHMQYAVWGKQKSLFMVDDMYVWLIKLDNPRIDLKLTIHSRSQCLH